MLTREYSLLPAHFFVDTGIGVTCSGEAIMDSVIPMKLCGMPVWRSRNEELYRGLLFVAKIFIIHSFSVYFELIFAYP